MSCNVKTITTTSENELVRKITKIISKSNCNYSKAFDILAVAVNEGYDIGKVTIFCDFKTNNQEEEIKYELTKNDLLLSRFGILGESHRDYITSKKWFDEKKNS